MQGRGRVLSMQRTFSCHVQLTAVSDVLPSKKEMKLMSKLRLEITGGGGDDSVKEEESSWETGSGDYQEASKDEVDSCSSEEDEFGVEDTERKTQGCQRVGKGHDKGIAV
jgi:hypothetical protein